MTNILAIAQKELRSYFASPIAYIVIGIWALLYGYFYASLLAYFVRQSMQMSQFGGQQPVNINEQMIRLLFQNVTILVLFLMPGITMRTYSEEKRSGTIELLLTSPVTDMQIILGKFFGAMALYAAMLAVTLIHVAILFMLRQPRVEADRDHLSGSSAVRRLLHLGGSAHLEPHEEPDRRLHGELRRVPAALDHRLDGQPSPGRRSTAC